jgi:hypothetical protein
MCRQPINAVSMEKDLRHRRIRKRLHGTKSRRRLTATRPFGRKRGGCRSVAVLIDDRCPIVQVVGDKEIFRWTSA